jgi:RNA polymerase sigma-70 factor (ECF subfamily)
MGAGKGQVEEAAIALIFRAESGSILASLIRQFRDFDLAEDALQDALIEALDRWPRDGMPRNMAAWLLTSARRRAIDRIRRANVAQDDVIRHAIVQQSQLNATTEGEAETDQAVPDERLRLIFTCCHPALNEDAQVALTLRTLCGLTTPEIARSFLVGETTMGQRLVRAKKKIRDAGIPYEVPEGEALGDRLAAVCDVIYLIFNEGFATSDGEAQVRVDLCLEAIRLARILYQLMPRPEPGGLLALLLLHDARRVARTSDAATYVPIDQQDRPLWHQGQIEEGTALLLECLAQRRPGPFQVQAAISAVHAQAVRADQTDWPQIAGLYRALYEMQPSPVVLLNRAVAMANAGQLTQAIDLLDSIREDLADYQPWHAARAELLARSNQIEEATIAYREAIRLSTNAAQRRFLQQQLDTLGKASEKRDP